MFKRISKILCLSLCTILTFVITVQTNATTINDSVLSPDGTQAKTQIVTDNNSFRIVNVTNGTEKSVATFNKKTQKVTITELGKAPQTISTKATTPVVNHKNQTKANSLTSSNSTSSGLAGTNYSAKYALGYDIYTDSTMDAYADHETPYWKLSMKYGGPQQSFESAIDSLCSNEVVLAAAVPAATLTAITTLVLASPETMGTTALIAALLAVGIVVASIVPVYNVYRSHAKAMQAYRLL